MPLSPALVERVLERLGFAERPAPDAAGLAALYAEWCQRVSFDNVRKLLHLASREPGPLPGDDAEDFFRAWLACGAGGTCWAVHGALHALLEALGFRARRVVATMLVVPDLPPNHGSVAVELEGERWFGRRVEIGADGRFAAQPLDAEARLRLLVDELGIAEAVAARLPPDAPLPPPPDSRTSRAAAAAAR